MMQRQVFLKGGRGDGTFSIYFFLDFSILHLKIALPFAKLCYVFKSNLFSAATIILWKKVILTCLKMSLKISQSIQIILICKGV